MKDEGLSKGRRIIRWVSGAVGSGGGGGGDMVVWGREGAQPSFPDFREVFRGRDVLSPGFLS